MRGGGMRVDIRGVLQLKVRLASTLLRQALYQGTLYLFPPRKSPPTPIGHLGEDAHKAPTKNITIQPSSLLFYTTTFANFISPRKAGLTIKIN